jgi:hypothetical protein
MNDRDYLGPHVNGRLANVVVVLVVVLAAIVAVVALPLQLMGG